MLWSQIVTRRSFLSGFGIAPAVLQQQNPGDYIASGKLGGIRMIEHGGVTIFYGTEGTLVIGNSTWQVHHKHGTVERFLLL